MSAKLSHRQKWILSDLARQAWQKAGPELDGISEEDFRHQEVARACGKLGLRCCDQNDYKLVESHFHDLLGHHAQAFNAQLRAATETKRVALHKIREACQEFGFQMAYAEAICRNQNHGRSLDDVDERARWRIFYTVRNRGLARKRKSPPVPKPNQAPLAYYLN